MEREVKLAYRAAKAVETGAILTQGDYNSENFVIRIFDGEAGINMYNLTKAEIYIKKPDGTRVQTDGIIDMDKILYSVGSNDIAAVGKCVVSVCLYTDSSRYTVQPFEFYVRADPDGDTVESTTEYGALAEAVILLEQVKEDYPDFKGEKGDKGDKGEKGDTGEQGPKGDTSESVQWENIQDKPTEFTPTAHNHNDSYYTKSEIDATIGDINSLLDNINGEVV